MQASPQMYGSMSSCFCNTVREEGVRGLYQGATPAVLGNAGRAAIVFMSYGICEEIVRQMVGHRDTKDMTVTQHASAGAMTGVVASLFLCPLEVVKCRSQALQSITTSAAAVQNAQRLVFCFCQ